MRPGPARLRSLSELSGADGAEWLAVAAATGRQPIGVSDTTARAWTRGRRIGSMGSILQRTADAMFA